MTNVFYSLIPSCSTFHSKVAATSYVSKVTKTHPNMKLVMSSDGEKATVDLTSVLSFARWHVEEKKALRRPEIAFLAVMLNAIFAVGQTQHPPWRGAETVAALD